MIEWALERCESQGKKMRGERLMDIKKYGFQMIWEWILKLEIICH
jgi:hypothetical protein